jgi:hypothetical protein
MTNYHSNLQIDGNTTTDELVEFVKEQASNPYQYNGTTVYNFSTHKVDEDALEQGIDNKFNRNLYQVPMQMLTGQVFVQSVLPQRIREAEILLYRTDEQDYYAYKNFVRDAPSEFQQKIQQEIADIIRKHE